MTHTKKSADHRFGGDWTTRKLDVLAGYLASYTTALRGKKFRTAFIDAFAGTGYRRSTKDADDTETLPFPDLADSAPQELLDGSARRALRTEPRFNKYVFIEKDAARCASLEGLKIDFPKIAEDIAVRRGDANTEIQALCAKNWRAHRAVLFLDPYGMQVDWTTIEAVAKTHSIDMWLLFPLGMGVNRVLTKSGHIPDAWRKRLDALLGTDDWYEEFYRVVATHTTLLGDEGEEHEVMEKASTETIGRYFNDRLKTIFAGVAEPGVLRNSTNNPLYLLCFACGNEKGKQVALRIANHLLKEMR